MAEPTSDTPRPCARCKSNPATLELRAEPVCPPCFQSFTLTKAVKRLAALRKAVVRPDEKRTCRYLAALSFGPSSAALIRMLHENLCYVRSKANSKVPVAYDILVLHIDTDLRSPAAGEVSEAEKMLARYKERFPDLEFRCTSLGDALKLGSVDWSALPSVGDEGSPADRMRALFDALPSVTSKADVLRLLIRHLLLAQAVENGCEALLLGCTTTALAELTLAEVAKGRGFSVPWQINDGPFPLPAGSDGGTSPGTLQIYYPLRDVFRKEIHTYLSLCDPPLTDLVVSSDPEAARDAVVSHKDLSIEEAMARYFESVEESYPAVVTNVVRTTGRLERAGGEGASCSVCGMTVDESGDARWKGEIGAEERDSSGNAPLCYGCERSIHG